MAAAITVVLYFDSHLKIAFTIHRSSEIHVEASVILINVKKCSPNSKSKSYFLFFKATFEVTVFKTLISRVSRVFLIRSGREVNENG